MLRLSYKYYNISNTNKESGTNSRGHGNKTMRVRLTIICLIFSNLFLLAGNNNPRTGFIVTPKNKIIIRHDLASFYFDIVAVTVQFDYLDYNHVLLSFSGSEFTRGPFTQEKGRYIEYEEGTFYNEDELERYKNDLFGPLIQYPADSEHFIADESDYHEAYYASWRTVYTGQDNCWVAYKRNHKPSRMLAVNESSESILKKLKIVVFYENVDSKRKVIQKDGNLHFNTDQVQAPYTLFGLNKFIWIGQELKVGSQVLMNYTKPYIKDGTAEYGNAPYRYFILLRGYDDEIQEEKTLSEYNVAGWSGFTGGNGINGFAVENKTEKNGKTVSNPFIYYLVTRMFIDNIHKEVDKHKSDNNPNTNKKKTTSQIYNEKINAVSYTIAHEFGHQFGIDISNNTSNGGHCSNENYECLMRSGTDVSFTRRVTNLTYDTR